MESLRELKLLRSKVNKRKRQLKEFLTTAYLFLNSIGERIHWTAYNYHTHSVYKINDLRGFSFFGNFGQTEFGGNSIEISFKGKKVLQVYSQLGTFNPEDGSFNLNIFEDSNDWQKALSILVEEKEEIIKEYLMGKKADIRREKKEKEASEKLEELEQQAKRLLCL